MDWLSVTAILILFMVNTVVQYRIGFRVGARAGNILGIYHTVTWMLKKNVITAEDAVTGKPIDAISLSKHIMSIEHEKLDQETSIKLIS